MGSTSFSLICLALVGLSIVNSADAVTCYECQWYDVNIPGAESKEGCTDKGFNEAGIKTCTGTSCYKSTGEGKFNGEDAKSVQRGCTITCTKGKSEVNGVKLETACCDGEKCNVSIVICASAHLIAMCLAIFHMMSA